MTPTSASHRTLISRAAPAGSHVPLIPEHWFPAAYDDGEAVLRHLITTGLRDEHDVPMELSASFLMGDSVGDNIAHHVGQRWKMTTASTLPPPSDIGSSSRKSAALPQVQGRSREAVKWWRSRDGLGTLRAIGSGLSTSHGGREKRRLVEGERGVAPAVAAALLIALAAAGDGRERERKIDASTTRTRTPSSASSMRPLSGRHHSSSMRRRRSMPTPPRGAGYATTGRRRPRNEDNGDAMKTTATTPRRCVSPTPLVVCRRPPVATGGGKAVAARWGKGEREREEAIAGGEDEKRRGGVGVLERPK
ncbi:hypothetical protein OsI_07728 [Oryza sativa Indica Group]|uniref:Alpha/beta hydrolase fold-3 domain-containing protein n=1 Tax=Oryza sativa subsp. indica TaxID=39946 RepID=B8AE94_ORYSI|nr:hypothetical protein OsI_07728 [Oryza sativa Indica Group]